MPYRHIIIEITLYKAGVDLTKKYKTGDLLGGL